jgi:4-carboxymuconolactone decarboxylase
MTGGKDRDIARGGNGLTDDIRRREAEVLGKPPRIPPLDRATIAKAAQESAARLRKAAFGDVPPLALDQIPEIVVTLLRYPELWESVSQLSIQLLGPSAVLPMRDRRLALLRTTWLCRAPYPWGEHVRQAREAGFGGEEIDRITIGSPAPGWSAHERAVLRAAEELHENAMISDPTWNALAETFDSNQLFELIVIIGQFTTVAYFENSLRLRLEPGNEGLSTR